MTCVSDKGRLYTYPFIIYILYVHVKRIEPELAREAESWVNYNARAEVVIIGGKRMEAASVLLDDENKGHQVHQSHVAYLRPICGLRILTFLFLFLSFR